MRTAVNLKFIPHIWTRQEEQQPEMVRALRRWSRDDGSSTTQQSRHTNINMYWLTRNRPGIRDEHLAKAWTNHGPSDTDDNEKVVRSNRMLLSVSWSSTAI